MAFNSEHSRRLFDFQSNFFDRGGLRLHYLDEGRGDPVLMLHGNPSWCFMYRRLVRALRVNRRVIVPDHIGCGLSSKPGDREYDYTLRSRVEDLSTLLDHLGIERSVTLIVHDWGGLIGLNYAVTHLDRIERLVVFNTAAFRVPPGHSLHWSIRLCRRSRIAGAGIRFFNLFSLAASYLGCRSRPMPADVRAAYLAPYDCWANRIAVLRFIQDIPLTPSDMSYALVEQTESRLELLRGLPMLICWGQKDFVFDEVFRLEWIRRFPEAEHHLFPQAGHFVLEDAFDEIEPIVTEFLDKPISSPRLP